MRNELPEIIQGGMGVNVSSPKLASVVAQEGGLGIVSGTGIGPVAARKLQDGDLSYLRAFENFPDQEKAQKLIKKYYVPGGIPKGTRYKPVAMYNFKGAPQSVEDLVVVANFAVVNIAKEGHNGLIGINYLEKLQQPHLASLYGAMLAGVDRVVMGAGIPIQIPGALDRLSNHDFATYDLDVEGADYAGEFKSEFDPKNFSQICLQRELNRPDFYAIIASSLLAKLLVGKRKTGETNGFIVEGPTAGGHNAPPRKKGKDQNGEQIPELNEKGEPIYGEKDIVDFEEIRRIGLPFWVAGSYASPEGLKFAQQELRANGIQVGTAFAFSEESGLYSPYRDEIRRLAYRDELDILTDPKASPSGFPFKVVVLNGSVAMAEVYEARPRLCDIGYLRKLKKGPEGRLILLCPSEPVEDYLSKGGDILETIGRKCLCNGLFEAAGMGQTQLDDYHEAPIFTSGDDHSFLRKLMKNEYDRYFAHDVLSYLRN